jgi:tetratricopeptide (TPR) repeat protein
MTRLLGLFYFIFGVLNINAQESGSFDEREFTKYLIQATGAKISGDIYAADSIYKKCLLLNPESGVVNFELSGLYISLDQPQKALEYANKAVILSPENEWYLANLAVLYKKINDHKKSAESFSKLVISKPEKISYLFSLTEELLNNNSYKKAIKVLDDIEKKIGIKEEISIQKHQIYLFLKNKKKAVIELENLISNEPESVSRLGLLAEYYENAKKSELAKAILNKMLSIDSSNGLVRLSLFQHYYKNKEYKKGYEELLLVMNSNSIEINLKKQILMQISYDKSSPYNISEVCNLAQSFLSIDSKNSDVLLLMGDFKMLLKEEDTACYYIRESLKINPSPFNAWSKLITSTLSRNKFDITINDAKMAIESHPNQPFPFLAIGIALNRKKEYTKALKELLKGKDLVFDDNFLESNFLQEIGNSYYGKEKFKISFNYYEMSIALDSNNFILLNNYSYYLALRKTNLERAEELMLKVIAKFPNNSTYLDTYGWVMFQLGAYSKSEKFLFKAIINSDGQSGEILEHYGDVLYKLKKIDEANVFWNKSKKTGNYSKKLIQKISENKFIE